MTQCARALAEVPEDAAVVLVHDAARPLLEDDVIERVVTALDEGWDGAVPGSAARGHGQARATARQVVETLARDELRRGADAAGVCRFGPA